MLDLVTNNLSWIFSGIGAAAVTGVIALVRGRRGGTMINRNRRSRITANDISAPTAIEANRDTEVSENVVRRER